METTYQPRSIEVDHDRQVMTIDWADGHHSAYPLEGLRWNCPCVICQRGHENMGDAGDRSLFLGEPDLEWRIKDLQQIGNHALQIMWMDGHSNGMYRWEYLRGLCPCEECYPPEERPA